MGDGPLQRQRLRQCMNMRRVSGADIFGLKSEVIIAVALLGGPAGVHDVDLRGHLVIWPKPCLANSGDCRIGEVAEIGFGRCFAELLQGVPDAVVCASGRKVITPAAGLGFFVCDDGFEYRGCFVDGGGIGVGGFECDHASAIQQHIPPFAEKCAALVGIVQGTVECGHVIDRNVRDDPGGMWDGVRGQRLARQLFEFRDIARAFCKVACVMTGLIFHPCLPL